MPEFIAGLLVGIFVGGGIGIAIMCFVQAHKLSVLEEDIKRGKDIDELL